MDTITLSRDWLDRCQDYSRSTIGRLSLGNPILNDPQPFIDKLALLKAGEVAYAHLRGLNPHDVVTWAINPPDRGYDLFDDGLGLRMRMHTISVGEQHLQWDGRKRELLAGKPFDAFALIKTDGEHFDIAGFMPRAVFLLLKHQAYIGDHSGLRPGTWYMHQDKLQPIQALTIYIRDHHQ